MIFYDWSGGMESSAMLIVDRQRISDLGAMVRWVDTGKHFPEMYSSKRQIEKVLDIKIVDVPRRISFDEYLFERGGMLRPGMNDCSRRMKRSNLARHMKSFERPYEVNLGYNAHEVDRAESFIDRNEKSWCHWRFPLIEAGVTREDTWRLCEKAGFTYLLDLYKKQGRADCFMCPNQKPKQALAVNDNYPELAAEWVAMEERKGHHFMAMPFKILVENRNRDGIQMNFSDLACGCFGGNEDVLEDVDAE